MIDDNKFTSWFLWSGAGLLLIHRRHFFFKIFTPLSLSLMPVTVISRIKLMIYREEKKALECEVLQRSKFQRSKFNILIRSDG